MSVQVHFLGIEIQAGKVIAALMDRQGRQAGAAADSPVPAEETDLMAVFHPPRWIRFISSLVRELVETSDIPAFKIWGCALVSAPGWICLDTQGEPMTAMHVMKPGPSMPLIDSVAGQISEAGLSMAHLGLLFPPKDFLRFSWSRILATDTACAHQLGLLESPWHNWSPGRLAHFQMTQEMLPPVFPTVFTCGRVGPDGADATGLHDSAWHAVGSHARLAQVAGCGCPDQPGVYCFADAPDHVFWIGDATAGKDQKDIQNLGPALEDGRFLFSAPSQEWPGTQDRDDLPVILDWRADEDPEAIMAWAEGTGRPVFKAPCAGDSSMGAAVMAALSSPMFSSPRTFFRKYPQPQAI